MTLTKDTVLVLVEAYAAHAALATIDDDDASYQRHDSTLRAGRVPEVAMTCAKTTLK
jgi:hypothetical protein